MSIKISELPSADSVGAEDLVPIVQSGITKKVEADKLRAQNATEINSSSTNDNPAGAKAVYDNCLKPENNTATGITTMDYNQSAFYKVGKVIIATINFHITAQVATNGNIYTSIPYIPLVNARGMIINTSGSAWCVNIRTDGTIKIMDRAIPTGWYNGFGMYVEEETTTRSLNQSKSANTEEAKAEPLEKKASEENSGDTFVEFNPTSLELPNEEQEEKLIEEITDGIINAIKETTEQEKQSETPETKEEQK